MYGGGAIGGVVNIVDNRIPTVVPQEPTGGVEYRHDSATDMDTAVFRGDMSSGALALHVDGLYRDWNNQDIPGSAIREVSYPEDSEHAADTTYGYIDNTDGRTKSLTAGGSYHFDSGFFGVAVSRLENEYGIPAGVHDHAEEESAELERGEEDEEGDIRLDVEQMR